MDSYRTFFIFGLLIVSLLLWEAWQNDYVRPQQIRDQLAQSIEPTVPATPSVQDLPDLPSIIVEAMPDLPSAAAMPSGGEIRVTTNRLALSIDPRGADIRQLWVLDHFEEAGKPDQPVQLLSDSLARFYVAQSGLRSAQEAPTHHDLYQAAADHYALADDADRLEVPLTWRSATGVVVTKVFTFHRDSYAVDVRYEIDNQSSDRFTAFPYAQFNRTRPTDKRFLLYTYTGPVFSSPGEDYDKVSFDDLDKQSFSRAATQGWVAMLQHYFVTAIVPSSVEEELQFYGNAIDQRNYIAGIRFQGVVVEPGEQIGTDYRMFLGPKSYPDLQAMAPKLDLTVDYGMLTIISKPLFIVMEWFYRWTGNWGWSIVLLTVLIKLVFYRLSAASYRSMAALRKLTPKLAALKERYGDDKQKFNQAMMDLYRTEKINPLGGCLPILVQMPVFLAFYWVLVESIELRHAPFVFWLQDLTAIDPYFILPLLFGLTMWFQQRLNPMPQDPAQAMMMKIFPIVFTVFFAFFPSGLVLYWLVNNLISIAQQWHITRKMGAL